jgi:3-phytase
MGAAHIKSAMLRGIPLVLLFASPLLAQVRIATFNASLTRNQPNQLLTDLSDPQNSQIRNIASIINLTNPDILLINEFDYSPNNTALDLFHSNFLTINYPHRRAFPSNTGLPTGLDLDNNGSAVTTPGTSTYAEDAFGFGQFPGQFAFALLSKHPIDDSAIRTFQTFKWKDMPGNLLESNLSTFYSPEERSILRLSSKNHIDIPINVAGQTIHLLASHPTPPAFDGPEDRNGKRNHDEIRFWRDYITPGAADYIYDDSAQFGGLGTGESFIILGDLNDDPLDGNSFDHPIKQLLTSPRINTTITPSSPGGPEQSLLQGRNNRFHTGDPAYDTADFNDFGPGNLRSDYVLPSIDLPIIDTGIFWPLNSDPLYPLVTASDHRLVYISIPEPASTLSLLLAILAWTHRRSPRI